MYYDQALYFTLASDRPTREHDSWALAAAQSRPRFEKVRIPYGRTTLPGLMLTADGAGSSR